MNNSPGYHQELRPGYNWTFERKDPAFKLKKKRYYINLNLYFRFSQVKSEIILPESVAGPKPVSDGWSTNPKRAIWPGRGWFDSIRSKIFKKNSKSIEPIFLSKIYIYLKMAVTSQSLAISSGDWDGCLFFRRNCFKAIANKPIPKKNWTNTKGLSTKRRHREFLVPL